VTTFDAAGADSGTSARSINIRGAITGFYFDNGAKIGFVRAPDGGITTFSLPGCRMVPVGINRGGEIAGECDLDKHLGHSAGFVRRANGKIQTFHVPQGGVGTQPTGINDAGVIGGYYNAGSFLRFP
jgi:hypothetical protein